MLDFKNWKLVVTTRDEILKLPDSSQVEQVLNNVREDLEREGFTKKEKLDFFKYLNTLFLTILVNNIVPDNISDIKSHSQFFENVKRARELLKDQISNLQYV
jgi:hypothetical protein